MERIYKAYSNTIKDQREDYPIFKIDLLKIDISDNAPKRKKKKIRKKIIKKLKKEGKLRENAKIWEYKKTEPVNDKEFIENLKNEKNLDDDDIKKLEYDINSKIPALLESYFQRFKSAFQDVFSLFEGYNNEVLEILAGRDRSINRSPFGLNQFQQEFLKISINLEDFFYWNDLHELHLIRNVLIHKDGIIDEEYINKSSIRKAEDLKKRIRVDENLLSSLYMIFLKYIDFMLSKFTLLELT